MQDHDAHPPHAAHDHDYDHHNGQNKVFVDRLLHVLPFTHAHSHADPAQDSALESSDRGIWALKNSLLGLGLTAALQLAVYLTSGSVGLLADTIHNASDALTAVPLWIAFALSRRGPNERYTYGYGRAEDVAGVVVILMIAASAIIAAYESIQKLILPSAPTNLIWVAVAALIGFAGNEAVAVFRIRVGTEIGSAALVADGQHARADGLTSLAVLLGVAGVWLGFPLADPIIGILITIAILFIVKDTALAMWHRIMDAVDPAVVNDLKAAAAAIVGQDNVHSVRARWLGHRLETEMHITVDEDLPTRESHRIAEQVRHALFHTQPRLSAATIHVDPCGHSGEDAHDLTSHHTPTSPKGGDASQKAKQSNISSESISHTHN